MTRDEALKTLDDVAADTVQAALSLGRLCIFIQAGDAGGARCIAPDVDPAELAKLLYCAADAYASHAAKQLPLDQIVRLRDKGTP